MRTQPWAVVVALFLSHACTKAGSPINLQAAVSQSGADVYCSGTDIIKIKRPLYPSRVKSPTFDYSFQLHKGSDPSGGTIIFIPGGPGETSVSPEAGSLNIYDVIRTDPRGTGCNKVDSVDNFDKFATTENVAADIAAIVTTQRITKFALYGASYGTAVATIAASALEANGATPTAVVLEGILGEAFDQSHDPRSSYIARWEEVRPTLATNISLELSKAMPFGIAADKWAAWLSQQLLVANINIGSAGWVRVPEYWLGKIDDPSLGPVIRDMISEAQVYDFDTYQERFYRQVLCGELSPAGHEADFNFINGKLLPIAKDACDGPSKFVAYDSARYLVKAPLFYFEGELDPSTPVWQATYHRDHHGDSKRYFTSVLKNGHAALSVGLADCGEKIWKSIMADGRGFSDSLATCDQKTSLTLIEPNASN